MFADNKSSAAGSTSGDDEDGGFDQMFWNMETRDMKRFFDALNVVETKSLATTKEVLRERKQLETSVENLLKLGFIKLKELIELKEKFPQAKEAKTRIQALIEKPRDTYDVE